MTQNEDRGDGHSRVGKCRPQPAEGSEAVGESSPTPPDGCGLPDLTSKSEAAGHLSGNGCLPPHGISWEVGEDWQVKVYSNNCTSA